MRIEINLLGGPKKRKAGAGLALPDFRAMYSQVKDPLLLGAVGSVVAAAAFVGILFTIQQAQLVSLNDQAESVRAESRRYSNLIGQKRQAERLRDSLIAELRAIREIDADRYVWPHLLEEVTKALPDYSWLVAVTSQTAAVTEGDTLMRPPVQFQVEGRTSEIAAYTRFLRRLAASPWLTNVVEGPATTVVEDENPIRAFSVTAQFRTADSAFIRTVPVTEAVQ